MSATVIARRYARALLNIAASRRQLQQVGASLDDVADALVASPPLYDLLANPKVPRVRKDAVLGEVLRGIAPDPIVATFVRYLSLKRRVTLLEDIRRTFHRLADLELGHAQALVTVATALDQAQTDALRRKIAEFSGKTITLNVQVDPDILGGVITRIDSSVWDGSLRSHLNGIRESITRE